MKDCWIRPEIVGCVKTFLIHSTKLFSPTFFPGVHLPFSNKLVNILVICPRHSELMKLVVDAWQLGPLSCEVQARFHQDLQKLQQFPGGNGSAGGMHVCKKSYVHVYTYGWFSVRVVVCAFHSEDICLPNFNATQWTASVHTLHMSKPVMQLVFKVLRNGLLRYILYTCPNL